jgi:hypothetical protein
MRAFRSTATRLATVGTAALLGTVGIGASTLVTATPASATPTPQEFAFNVFLFGGSLGYSAIALSADWAASAATVKQGSNFTFTSQPSTTVIPTTSSGFTLASIQDNINYYPIPTGTTYVGAVASGPVSYTLPNGGATSTSPLTITYCATTSSPGCTATPTSTTFLGSTPAPYLQVSTQPSLVFPAGGSITTPGVTVTLTGQTGGTTANWVQTEFKTTSTLAGIGPVNVVGYPYSGVIPGGPVPSLALAPPLTLASISVAGSASVTSVLPNSGPLAGGTQVKVIGTFLDNAVAVTFGGLPATNVTPLTSNSLLATSPPGLAGSVDVQVITATSGSPASASDRFTYTAGPIVTGTSPNTGPPAGGTSVTITGQQLAGATAVHFGSATGTITANTATSITATSPAGSGVVDVTVTAGGKTSTISQQDRFSYYDGYFLGASDGGVFAYGNAPFNGSAGGNPLNKPVVGGASTSDGGGYWLVASDGGVFAYGNAQFFGSSGNLKLNSPVVGIVPSPDGFGYWLVGADGGVFAYGDAQFFGSMGTKPLNKPVVGIAAAPDGGGYWLVASDGGIFAFGDAAFAGSQGSHPLNAPVVGIAATSTGKGYWMAAADGGVFNEGDAAFAGSAGGAPLNKPVVGIAGNAASGYWLAASDGGIFNYGVPFYGSAGGKPLNQPVVGIAAS